MAKTTASKNASKKTAPKTSKAPKKAAKAAPKAAAPAKVPRPSKVVPAVAWDHDTKLVHGTISSFQYDEDDKTGSIDIVATDGSKHEAQVVGRTAIRHGLIQWVGANNDKLTHYLGKGKGQLAKLTADSPRLFRIAGASRKSASSGTLFGITGPTYMPFTVEDVVEQVQSVLPKGATLEAIKSDGTSGGALRVTVGKFDFVRLGFTIDGGSKNGREAASLHPFGTVLACDNQLTMEVSGLVARIPGVVRASRNRHTKSPVARLIENVSNMGNSMGEVADLLKQSQKLKLTRNQMDDILFYYMACGRISRRSVESIRAALDQKGVQQVPNTLYGLGMAVSYVGTHGTEIGEGVRLNLGKVAGEMLVVSGHFKEYMKVITENQPPEAAKLPQVEVQATPKKAPAAKKSSKASAEPAEYSPKATKSARKARSPKPAPGEVAVTDKRTGSRKVAKVAVEPVPEPVEAQEEVAEEPEVEETEESEA